MDVSMVEHTAPVKLQSASRVQRWRHTVAPLSVAHAAEPGHSDEVAAGVAQREVQKSAVRRVAVVVARQSDASEPHGRSRLQSW
jgi:hypothetical protein